MPVTVQLAMQDFNEVTSLIPIVVFKFDGCRCLDQLEGHSPIGNQSNVGQVLEVKSDTISNTDLQPLSKRAA
eukprot:2346918-Amphidinium_carterae.1